MLYDYPSLDDQGGPVLDSYKNVLALNEVSELNSPLYQMLVTKGLYLGKPSDLENGQAFASMRRCYWFEC